MEEIIETKKENGYFYCERIEPMFMQGKRDWSVDVLRCLSCFLVIVIHATRMTQGYGHQDTGEIIYLHNDVYAMLAAAPTVLFVMVSGIFFLSPERNVRIGKVWRKNILKMAFAYIFWCGIYACYTIHMMDPQPEEITREFFVQQWMVQPSHLWYIPMIIGLYMICPILRPITATGDKKLFMYIIALFIGGLILWTIYNLPNHPVPDAEGVYTETPYAKPIIDKTPMALICQYPFWMLFGWIAYSYRPGRGFRILIYTVGIVATAVGIMINIHFYCELGDLYLTGTTQKFSIFSFFKNVAIFYFIVTVFREHEFSRPVKFVLRKWSDYTLIIYLVHFLILTILYDNNIFYDNGMSAWVGVWVYSIVTYFAGGLLALMFHLIWDPIKKAFSNNKR